MGALLLVSVSAVLPAPAMAEENPRYRRVYDARLRQYVFVREESWKQKARTTFRNPIVKQAAIGAGIGAAAGAISDRTSMVKGAGLGALVGAGTGLVDQSRLLEDRPMVRRAVKGAGIGAAATTVTGGGALRGAGIGAGLGAGSQLLQNILNDDEQ